MSEEKDNPAQNAPKTFSEIMEKLKATLDKAAKAVAAGTRFTTTLTLSCTHSATSPCIV
jgi:hypothetical protein